MQGIRRDRPCELLISAFASARDRPNAAVWRSRERPRSGVACRRTDREENSP